MPVRIHCEAGPFSPASEEYRNEVNFGIFRKYNIRAIPYSICYILDGCKETVHARCCHWLATSAAFTAKATSLPTSQSMQIWAPLLNFQNVQCYGISWTHLLSLRDLRNLSFYFRVNHFFDYGCLKPFKPRWSQCIGPRSSRLQLHNSPTNSVGELFKPSTDSASLLILWKYIFCLEYRVLCGWRHNGSMFSRLLGWGFWPWALTQNTIFWLKVF